MNVPDEMIGGERRQRIWEDSYVNIYLAGRQSNLWYPWKLQHVGYAQPDSVQNCETYLIDSNIMDESVENTDVLDRAVELGADRIVPKDYLDQPERTIESINDFLKEYFDSLDVGDMDIVVPVQPPFSRYVPETISVLREWGIDETETTFLLGGYKKSSPKVQLLAILRLMATEYNHLSYHGLGMGGSWTFVRALRRCPDLLESFDNSTPIHHVRTGKVMDSQMKAIDCSLPRGKYSTVIGADYLSSIMLMMNYVYGPYCREFEDDDGVEQLSFKDREIETAIRDYESDGSLSIDDVPTPTSMIQTTLGEQET